MLAKINGPARRLVAAGALTLALSPIRAGAEDILDGTSATTFTHLSRAVRGAGPSLAPLGLAAAWLAALTLTRTLAYRRSRIFPAALCDQLNLVALGTVPDRELLRRRALASPGPLANVVRRVLTCPGWSRAERRSSLEDAVECESATLRSANGWYDVIYATSTLIGLLAALIGLIAAFSQAATAGTAGATGLNASIASALSATGAGVLLAVLARVVGEVFRQRHQAVVVEMFQRGLGLVDRGGDDAGEAAGSP